jgi:hypothetical protein
MIDVLSPKNEDLPHDAVTAERGAPRRAPALF